MFDEILKLLQDPERRRKLLAFVISPVVAAALISAAIGGLEAIHTIGLLIFLVHIATWILILHNKIDHAEDQLEKWRSTVCNRIIENDDLLLSLLRVFRNHIGDSAELESLLKEVVTNYLRASQVRSDFKIEADVQRRAFGHLRNSVSTLKFQGERIPWNPRTAEAHIRPLYKKKGVRIRATNIGYVGDLTGYFGAGGLENLMRFNIDRMARGAEGCVGDVIQRIYIVTRDILTEFPLRAEQLELLFKTVTESTDSGAAIKIMEVQKAENFCGAAIPDFSLFDWLEEDTRHEAMGLHVQFPSGKGEIDISYDSRKIAELKLDELFTTLWKDGPGIRYLPNQCADVQAFHTLLSEW